MKIIEGRLTNTQFNIGLLASRFNSFITEKLVEGAVDCLQRHGVDDKNLTLVKVPGAFELPIAAKAMAAAGRVQGIVALGTVIRGATPHFDYVAGECTKGLAQVSLESGIPIGFGVLTCDSIEQAIERAGTKAGNKGADAALAVLETLDALQQIKA